MDVALQIAQSVHINEVCEPNNMQEREMKQDKRNTPDGSQESSSPKEISTPSFFRTLLTGAFCLSLIWEVDQTTLCEAAELPGKAPTEYAMNAKSPESMTGVIVEMKIGRSGITNMEVRMSPGGNGVQSGCIHQAEGKIIDVVVDPSMMSRPEQGVMVVLEKHVPADLARLAPGECVQVTGDKLRRIDPVSDEDRIQITQNTAKVHRIARMEALSIRIEPILTAGTTTRPAGRLRPTRLPNSAMTLRQPA